MSLSNTSEHTWVRERGDESEGKRREVYKTIVVPGCTYTSAGVQKHAVQSKGYGLREEIELC